MSPTSDLSDPSHPTPPDSALFLPASPAPDMPPADDALETTSDLMLAQMLQMQFDREFDDQLRLEERKFNGDNKGASVNYTHTHTSSVVVAIISNFFVVVLVVVVIVIFVVVAVVIFVVVSVVLVVVVVVAAAAAAAVVIIMILLLPLSSLSVHLL